jgi:hypothetical protein
MKFFWLALLAGLLVWGLVEMFKGESDPAPVAAPRQNAFHNALSAKDASESMQVYREAGIVGAVNCGQDFVVVNPTEWAEMPYNAKVILTGTALRFCDGERIYVKDLMTDRQLARWTPTGFNLED